MFNLPDSTTFKGYKLIIPSVCVGNVSQLTCDLLIESLKLDKIAECFHSSIIPLIGPAAFRHQTDQVTTAADLFSDDKLKLLLLQLRTPLAEPLMHDFFEQLVDFVTEKGIQEVFILTSSYAYEKKQVTGSSFWCKTSGIQVESVPQSAETKILGGGYGLKMYQKLVEKGIPALILYKFVSEGDNVPDAVDLLQKFNEILPVFDKSQALNVKMPISWKALFGNRAPDGIY